MNITGYESLNIDSTGRLQAVIRITLNLILICLTIDYRVRTCVRAHVRACVCVCMCVYVCVFVRVLYGTLINARKSVPAGYRDLHTQHW